MAGANIFVMYTDGSGNVTISPRLGKGHFEPEHDTAANITLLEGSGLGAGRMVANVRCANCDRWNGGSMDFSAGNGDWIYAWQSGDSLDSTDVSEEIEQHDQFGVFTWNFAQAQGGNDDNPFFSNGRQVSAPPNSASSGGSGTLETSGESDAMLTAHGTLGAIVFLALLPGGAISIRIPSLSRFIWVHGGIQIFAYCVFIVTAGMGIYMAHTHHLYTHPHSIIGIVLLVVLFTQPFVGLLHHMLFKRKQKRTVVSYEHIWVGRAAIILGMINGGLGLKLASVTDMGTLAAYGVVAGVIGTAYIATIVFAELKRRREGQLGGQRGQQKQPGDDMELQSARDPR